MLDSLWNYFSPFALFKDASRGSFAERAAAYRYNVDIRGYLLTYISRWIWSGAAALLLTGFFEALSPVNGDLTIFVILAAVDAVFATLAACAVCVLAYSYASLAYHASQTRDASRRR
jgi:hypothetical protein